VDSRAEERRCDVSTERTRDDEKIHRRMMALLASVKANGHGETRTKEDDEAGRRLALNGVLERRGRWWFMAQRGAAT
jgi:hypothetical protein